MQRFRYLPHVDGEPFGSASTVKYCNVLLRPSCDLSVCHCNVPLAVAMSFALHCNVAHHLGVAPFTVVCPTVSITLDTIYHFLLQCFSSRCSTALEVPHCNTPRPPAPSTHCNAFQSAKSLMLQSLSSSWLALVATLCLPLQCNSVFCSNTLVCHCNAARSSPLVPGGSGSGQQQQQQRQRWPSPSLATTMIAVQRCDIHRHYRQ